MSQFSSTIAIDNAHTVPQRVLDCRPGIGELNQVYRPKTKCSLFLYPQTDKNILYDNANKRALDDSFPSPDTN